MIDDYLEFIKNELQLIVQMLKIFDSSVNVLVSKVGLLSLNT